jgi:hypothetical protein
MIRTQKFGRGSVILTARGNEAISMEEIQAKTPAVFAEAKHDSRSERYTYIPTREVLAGLIGEGFMPYEVRQGGSNDEIKRAHTKHMIRLRHQSTGFAPIRAGDVIVPELILLNSHDGTSAYKLTSGAFRMVCTNGLIAGEIFDEVRVAHKGDVRDNVIEGAFRVMGQFPELMENAREFSAVTMSDGEQLAFARAARELRWEANDQGNSAAPIEPATLLRAKRREDAEPSLWATFNRVQENLIRGEQSYVHTSQATGRRSNRQTVAVNGIDQNRAINRALWTLTEEMRKLKAAA